LNKTKTKVERAQSQLKNLENGSSAANGTGVFPEVKVKGDPSNV
jgi:hypothetical protein